MFRRFTKEEFLLTLIIFLLIATVSFFNFRSALMRSRDATRRNDLGAISNALMAFYEDFGYFPPAENGKIKYCKADNFDEVIAGIGSDELFDRNKFFQGLRDCEWGKDSFDDLLDEDYDPYIERLPLDPRSENNLSYLYFSNTKRFQLYTHLEEGEDAQGHNA